MILIVPSVIFCAFIGFLSPLFSKVCCESALLKLLGPVALPLDLELSSDMLRALGPNNGSLDREKLRLVGGTLYYTKRRLSPERVGLHAVYYIYSVYIVFIIFI